MADAATPIVLQLQQEAAGSSTSIAELLRKAMLVARKLQIDDFRVWIAHELDGYEPTEPVPAYRKISGELQADNPIRGMVPVMAEDHKFLRKMSAFDMRQSVPELQELASRQAHASIRARMPHLDTASRPTLPVYLIISESSIHGILSTVRNVILNWALDLEERGILGQGITFSSAEKQVASATHYQVNNFYGSGAVAQVMQGHQNTQVFDASGINVGQVLQLLAALRAEPVDESLVPELSKHLNELETQLKSQKPDKGALRTTLEMVKDVVTTGGVAVELVDKISTLIASLQ